MAGSNGPERYSAKDDRRYKIVSSHVAACMPIVSCIGRVYASYNDSDDRLSTATAFNYDPDSNLVFALTCAHNLIQRKGKAPRVIFERRVTYDVDSGKPPQVAQSYKCTQFGCHPGYKPDDASASSLSSDMAWLAFEDDGFYAKLFNECGKSMQLTSSDQLRAGSTQSLYLFGYPIKTHIDSKVQRLKKFWGEMWGMDARCVVSSAEPKADADAKDDGDDDAEQDKAKEKPEEKPKDGDQEDAKEELAIFREESGYLKYNVFDSEPGQTGAPILVAMPGDVFGIIAVHSRAAFGEMNRGVPLTDEKLQWLQGEMVKASWPGEREIRAFGRAPARMECNDDKQGFIPDFAPRKVPALERWFVDNVCSKVMNALVDNKKWKVKTLSDLSAQKEVTVEYVIAPALGEELAKLFTEEAKKLIAGRDD